MGNNILSGWLINHWYNSESPPRLLQALSWLFVGVVTLRRWAYAHGFRRITRLAVPVIVVGNISVGGTGKTPLVVWLVAYLRAAGWKPGIISRGYGGSSGDWPQRVTRDSDPNVVGDEPLLIIRRSGAPVAVGPDRIASARILLDQSECDLIISDDGLQHYALGRDIEVAVVDGQRRYGNGYCLPAGPLREPIDRLKSVDLIVCNGDLRKGELAMVLSGNIAVNLCNPGRKIALKEFNPTTCHAIAGIGNPQRFFDHLRGFGLQCDEHAFSDHYTYRREDLLFSDEAPILMTEKDAVKCESFGLDNCWYVPVDARPDVGLGVCIDELLRKKIDEQ